MMRRSLTVIVGASLLAPRCKLNLPAAWLNLPEVDALSDGLLLSLGPKREDVA